jgi:A/G-specific adenine glycosylase
MLSTIRYTMQLTDQQISSFQSVVWEYYRQQGRELPWREDPTPYQVLVSELMLQQTQVSRVIPKYNAFLYTCPNIAVLAEESLGEVLTLWSGLGYNRRAKFLHLAAVMVVRDYNGILPQTTEELIKLPGIGKNTAGAIMAYAFNKPVVFVETNIRTVFFHHFFTDASATVSDKELEGLVGQTLDRENPREWYWALMDYGTYLKKTAGARLNSSKHYVKQSPLKGSLREMRGRIIKKLVSGPLQLHALEDAVIADERFDVALKSLIAEGMVSQKGKLICLTGTPKTP